MKKFLILLLLLKSTLSNGKNLTLNDLFLICNKSNWVAVNEFLLNRGWEYNKSTKGVNNSFSTVIWTYNKINYSDEAQAWFRLYTFEGLPNKISYSFFNKESYTIIKSGITAANLKLVENSIENNELIAKYSGENFSVSIITAKQEDEYSDNNSITAYTIEVIKKSGIYDPNNGKKKNYYDNGQIKYEYNLTDGKLNGPIKTYYENGNLERIGNYINGKEDGKFTEYDEDGIITGEYTMVKGLMNGLLTIYKNGLKSQEINMQNGIKNGSFVRYHYSDEGIYNIKTKGTFIDDKKEGLWQTYIISEGKEELVEYENYSNDEKNGEFQEYVNTDTLIIGNYKNGILNDYYIRKTRISGFDENFEEESWWTMESEGNYKNGLKDGRWIYYFMGGKSDEGNYQEGNKIGKWTKYVRIGNHIGKVLCETNYVNGKENGICKNYFIFQTISDTSDENPSFEFINIPVQEKYIYKDGILEGEYELKDSANILISKGNYKNDKKNGIWIESYLMNDSDNNSYRIYQKGNYLSDNKNGVWEEYINENHIIESKTYKIGRLEGETIKFYSNKKPFKIIQFKNDELKSLEIYDSLENKLTHKYEIISRNDNLIKCNYTTINKNTSTRQGYEFISSFNEFNPYYFDIDFSLSVSDSSDIVYEEMYLNNSNLYTKKEIPSKNEFLSNPIKFSSKESTTLMEKGWKKEGIYEQREISSNKALIVGSFKNNLKNGIWKTFYYENGIYISQNFINGVGELENYLHISDNKPFSGKFELKYENGNPKLEQKISNGLRDGKSRYYDENGKPLKTEKYSNGILEN